jgi:DNA-binding CsgD family transcriptional regulator
MKADLGPSDLTPREIQILHRIANGRETRDIAEEFGSSPETVKNQLTSCYRKLGARNRVHAVVLAIRAGVVDLEDFSP